MTDKRKAQKKWDAQNLGVVKAAYKKDFVLDFKIACARLGKTQSEVIREAMNKTIEQAEQLD